MFIIYATIFYFSAMTSYIIPISLYITDSGVFGMVWLLAGYTGFRLASTPIWIFMQMYFSLKTLMAVSVILQSLVTLILSVTSSLQQAIIIRSITGFVCFPGILLAELMKQYLSIHQHQINAVMKGAVLTEIFGYTSGLLLGGLTSFSNESRLTSESIFDHFVLFIPSAILSVFGIILFMVVRFVANNPIPVELGGVRQSIQDFRQNLDQAVSKQEKSFEEEDGLVFANEQECFAKNNTNQQELQKAPYYSGIFDTSGVLETNESYDNILSTSLPVISEEQFWENMPSYRENSIHVVSNGSILQHSSISSSGMYECVSVLEVNQKSGLHKPDEMKSLQIEDPYKRGAIDPEELLSEPPVQFSLAFCCISVAVAEYCDIVFIIWCYTNDHTLIEMTIFLFSTYAVSTLFNFAFFRLYLKQLTLVTLAKTTLMSIIVVLIFMSVILHEMQENLYTLIVLACALRSLLVQIGTVSRLYLDDSVCDENRELINRVGYAVGVMSKLIGILTAFGAYSAFSSNNVPLEFCLTVVLLGLVPILVSFRSNEKDFERFGKRASTSATKF